MLEQQTTAQATEIFNLRAANHALRALFTYSSCALAIGLPALSGLMSYKTPAIGVCKFAD